MDIMVSIRAVSSIFQNCAGFHGRASRPEFWWPFLFIVVLQVIPIVGFVRLSPIIRGLSLIIIWAPIVVPFLAVLVRRLHDTRRSRQFIYMLLAAAMLTLIVAIFVAFADMDMSDGYAGLQVIAVILLTAVGWMLLLGIYLVAILILTSLGADMDEHRSVIGILKLPGLRILLLVVAGVSVWLPLEASQAIVASIIHDESVFGVFGGAVLVVLISFPIALLLHLASGSDPEQNPHGIPQADRA